MISTVLEDTRQERTVRRLSSFFASDDFTAIEQLILGPHFADIARRELMLFGPGIIGLFRRFGIKVRGLAPNESFGSVSEEMRRSRSHDNPHELALFVWPERTLYVKVPKRGVFSHECSHALDHCLALAAGVDACAIYDQIKANPTVCPPLLPFYSNLPNIRPRLGRLADAVTVYGQTSFTESWAEGARAYCGVNDGSGLFSTVSSSKLRTINRSLYSLILETFLDLNGRAFERSRQEELRSA